MHDNQNRGLEVGETTNIVDYFKSKFTQATNSTLMFPEMKKTNPAVFVEENCKLSKWSDSSKAAHM